MSQIIINGWLNLLGTNITWNLTLTNSRLVQQHDSQYKTYNWQLKKEFEQNIALETPWVTRYWIEDY